MDFSFNGLCTLVSRTQHFFLLFFLLFSAKVSAADYLIFAVDLSAGNKLIENKFSDVNVWYFGQNFGAEIANSQPSDYFSKNYPFLKRVQLMTATGGSQERDLFVSPNERTNLTDYKFDHLIAACRNIIRFGLKPEIKTGNVPLKLSANPYISASFGVNVRPPADYEQYYRYIKAVSSALVSEFGLEEVKTWSWGVLTEYENREWFLAEDGSPESTKIAYLKLYDYTVAALEEVIGAENLVVGAHSMTSLGGLWDEREFIDHVALGNNYKTGEVGTQIDFLAISFYDTQPGVLNNNSFDYYIDILRDRAKENGLHNLKFGIDEGRILKGVDGKALTNYELAMSYQGAANAKNFKLMIEKDIGWFSSWGVTTEGLFGGIDTVGTHVANLGYKMVGDAYIKTQKYGNSIHEDNEVDAIVSVDVSKNTARLMLYNYNKNFNSISTENVLVRIDNFNAIFGRKVMVKKWIVDDNNSNYWPAWWSDMEKNGIVSSSFNRSQYSIKAGSQLKNKSDRDFWYANEKKYTELAELKPSISHFDVIDGVVTLSTELAHHSVVFYEISPVDF